MGNKSTKSAPKKALRKTDVSRRFSIADAKVVVDAWENLEGGRRYSAKDIERWLINDMKPAIDMLRKKINGG